MIKETAVIQHQQENKVGRYCPCYLTLAAYSGDPKHAENPGKIRPHADGSK